MSELSLCRLKANIYQSEINDLTGGGAMNLAMNLAKPILFAHATTLSRWGSPLEIKAALNNIDSKLLIVRLGYL